MTPDRRRLSNYSHVDRMSCSEKSVHNSTLYSHVDENGSSCLCGERRHAAGQQATSPSHKKAVIVLSSLVQVDFLQQQQQGKSPSPWDASEAIIES